MRAKRARLQPHTARLELSGIALLRADMLRLRKVCSLSALAEEKPYRTKTSFGV